MQPCLFRPSIHEQGPHQSHRMGERQTPSEPLHHVWQGVQGKKYTAQKHHRREEQREVIGEEVVAFGQGIKDQGQTTEGDTHAQQNRPSNQ